MPTLSQQIARINQKTSFMFTPDEVIAALNEAGLLVYQKILKENRGFFVKVDETSLLLTPGVQGQDQVYDLPDDCSQILHLAERLQSTPSMPWRPMEPTSLGHAFSGEAERYVNFNEFASGARFQYSPFLTAIDTAGDFTYNVQRMSIAVTPTVDQNRVTQLIYSAKWIPLTDSSSKLMLPEECTTAQYNFAMASLCGDMDDTRMPAFEQKAQVALKSALQWCVDRQLQRGLRVKSYL